MTLRETVFKAMDGDENALSELGSAFRSAGKSITMFGQSLRFAIEKQWKDRFKIKNKRTIKRLWLLKNSNLK